MHNFVIETDHLILRPLSINDCDAVFKWVSDEDVTRYMVYNTYQSKEQVIDWLTYLQSENTDYHFGFVRKEDGQLIGSGSTGPSGRREGCFEIGYNLRRDAWGFGFATEAAKAMIRFANEQLGITKFFASHAEQNKASGHVMEKCGLHFVRFGEFKKLDGSCPSRSMEYEGIIE